MSVYKGSFSDYDYNVYDIEIDGHLVGDSTERLITLSDNPCIITSDSQGVFSPIKSRSCSIEIVSGDYLSDIYTPKSRGVKVTVTKHSDSTVLFKGWLTPAVYDQSYDYLNTISLEAVDCVSTTKDYKYSPLNGSEPKYQKMIKIVLTILNSAGYTGDLYVPKSFTHINGVNYGSSRAIDDMYVSEGNFYDDDDAHTPWTQYEVLEEILKYWGWSLCPFGNDVYLIDYRIVGTSTDNWFDKYSLISKTYQTSVLKNDTIRVGDNYNGVDLNILAPGSSSISMDDVYNKIEINDNLYEIEEIAPDIFDDETHISITDEKGFGYNSGQWTRTTVKKKFLQPDEVTNEITGYEYQTICRIKPTTNWTHHFYSMNSLNDSEPTEVINDNGQNYYEEGISSEYTSGPINHYCNTHGALIQHYAYRKNNGSILPTSLDWSDYLTFFVTNDTLSPYSSGTNKGKIAYSTIRNLEQPVLEYEIPEEVMFKPSSGKSWITIKGDLFYQYNDAKWGDKNENTLNIVNTTSHYYTTAPVDKACEIDEKNYLNFYRKTVGGQTKYYLGGIDLSFILAAIGYTPTAVYGDGYEMWKFKVQIGNKYWNGSSWTTTESTFYIPYNNSPENGDDEYMPAFKWASLRPNVDYTSKVGENCYAIPIDSTISSHPSFGKVHITVYTPLVYPKVLFDIADHLINSQGGSTGLTDIHWYDIPPCIYVKDFEVGYVYTDANAWYSQHKANETTSDDVVYTGIINEEYVSDFDSLQLKINTENKDKPISRSYTTTSNKYISTIKHSKSSSERAQEYNLVDQYYEHYSSPKKIYNVSIRGLYGPMTKVNTSTLSGRFIIDTYSYDIRTNINNVKLIEY